MATSYDCKFIETSVGINHNVDELLVGLLTQIRLKLENPERTREMFRKRSRKNRSKSPLGSCSENNSPKKYRGSRTSTSLKVRNLLDKVWARDSKSKSCENLHVLWKICRGREDLDPRWSANVVVVAVGRRGTSSSWEMAVWGSTRGNPGASIDLHSRP